MLLCPPQHGKSTVASKRAPAYLLGRDPTLDIISASATSLLAEEFGGAVRNCVNSPEYGRIFGAVKLAEDSQAKGRWQTTDGGGYYAVGIGGALFGRGAGLGIVDDPFATWADAQSETARRRVWEWYRGTFYNRIRPGGAIVIIQHRMHEDDLVGRLLAEQETGGDKWEVVELPAHINKPPWPERYNSEALARIKANTDRRQWSALYMQNPTPEDGTFFQRDWFRRYTPEQLPKSLHRYMTSDHAPAGEVDSDYSCVRVWGVCPVGDLYMLDGFRHQETLDKTTDRVIGNKKEEKRGLIQRHKPFCWFPEDDNNWKAAAGFVKRLMREQNVHCRIEPMSPHGADKPTKAQPFQAMASSGRVWLPVGPDGDDVLDQYLKFPAGKYDDEVDAAAVIGRALDQAHPAIAKHDEPAKKRDSWDKAFGNTDDDSTDWKTV
jgi:predicted phage terminase large subunit-like protein